MEVQNSNQNDVITNFQGPDADNEEHRMANASGSESLPPSQFSSSRYQTGKYSPNKRRSR